MWHLDIHLDTQVHSNYTMLKLIPYLCPAPEHYHTLDGWAVLITWAEWLEENKN